MGKTFVSAALCEITRRAYFKPVQAGAPKDLKIIKKFCKNTKIFQSAIELQTPKSPHIGQKIERKFFDFTALKIPNFQDLGTVVETAGGLFSPIDERRTMLDFLCEKNLPVFLVAREYLGAINHTILSVRALQIAQIPLLGLIVSGKMTRDVWDFVRQYTNVKILHLPFFNAKNFASICQIFSQNLLDSRI